MQGSFSSRLRLIHHIRERSLFMAGGGGGEPEGGGGRKFRDLLSWGGGWGSNFFLAYFFGRGDFF